MDELYGKQVFDEWAILKFHQDKALLLDYAGPRKDDFRKHFSRDAAGFRTALASQTHANGDFEFDRNGFGTKVDAFVVLGDSLYLFCNNVSQSMTEITRDSKWLSAQVPFVEFCDKFRSDPLVV